MNFPGVYELFQNIKMARHLAKYQFREWKCTIVTFKLHKSFKFQVSRKVLNTLIYGLLGLQWLIGDVG